MSSKLFLLFQGIGFIFLIGCFVLFVMGKDAALKRKFLLPFCVVSGMQVVARAYFLQGLVAALVVTAFAVFVSQLFLRNLVFCDQCARIVNGYYGADV